MDPVGTRKTLINRLRQTNSDTHSWSEFYELYWKLVYSVARKAGLSETDTEDVVQETFLEVSKSIKKFDCLLFEIAGFNCVILSFITHSTQP